MTENIQTSPSKGIALLERLDQIHGPRPLSRVALFPSGAIRERVIASRRPGAACTPPETLLAKFPPPVAIVLDNGPIHTSRATRAALEARKHWLTPGWLAKYAPELNDIGRDWKTIKTHHLAHKTFENRDSLQATIETDIQSSIQAEKGRSEAPRKYRSFVACMPNLGLPCPARGQT